jgi:hypothetical protein
MSTNERPSDDAPRVSTQPSSPASSSDSTAPAPSSESSVSGSVSGGAARTTGAKKKKKKKKANGSSASVTPPPVATVAPEAAKHASDPPAAAKTKSVPPPSAANTNGAAKTEGREDDESVPPAADLDHHFFEAHSAQHAHDSLHLVLHPDDVKAPDQRLAALMREETQRRRAQFTKYVKIVFAASIVVCLAAVISVSVRRTRPDQTIAVAATTPMRPMRQAPPPPPPMPETAETTQMAAPLAVADPAVTDEAPAASVEASASATAAPSDTAPAPPPSVGATASTAALAVAAPVDSASDAPAELDSKAALKEKRQAQRSLDNGKVADAIDHGEASVKLDPTDAEAWLILGAAYQMKGDLPNAKRSFGSCLKEGKRGPRGECAAMPH